ncbi:MAG: glycosyltransferase family 39 protein [Gemmatimonadaceae bacterium]|nr:glycosyltransferase family 39 protein [Gemmatimonadaceae bacterium]
MNVRSVDERTAILLITAIAVIARLAVLWQPMRYDESVTWAYFVGRPWSTIVSSYQFPNNHVFFSLLAKLTAAVAPFQPWALRLPAFLAGVAVVPLTWAVGRRFATPAIGLIGAALAAGSTTLVLYSTNARGYTLVVALFLVLLLLADRLRTSQRLSHWAMLAVLGAVGLYTIPVMLYPLGIVVIWLLLAARQASGAVRRGLAVRAVAAALSAGALALLLYLPIIRNAGLGALAGNKFVEPSPWPMFIADIPRHLVDTLLTWTSPFSWWAVPLLLLLGVVGLHRIEPASRPSLVLASALWCGGLLVATHRAPFVRVWLFLLPLFHLAVARGIVRVASTPRVPRAFISPAAATALAVLVATLTMLGDTVRRSGDTGSFRSAREVTERLKRALRPGDRVLAPIPTNGPLLYYFSAQGLDTALLNTPPESTRRAFLVLDPARGRTLDWAVSVGMIDPALYATPTLLLRRADVELWSSDRR